MSPGRKGKEAATGANSDDGLWRPALASPNRQAQPDAALSTRLTRETREFELDPVGLPLARLDRHRAATPLDQRDTKVQGYPIEGTDSPSEARLVLHRLVRWVVVTTASGRQCGIHDWYS
jgi:hypothetical protein